MPDNLDWLDEICENDPFGLLEVRSVRRSAITDIDRLLESFESVCVFYDEYGREPREAGDEFHLRARLEGIREDAEKVRLLLPHDRHDLLADFDAAPPSSMEEVFEDDPFGLLEVDAADILELKHVPAGAQVPDYIARRKPCPNFQDFQALFEQCQADINGGARFTSSFSRDKGIAVGDFFILRGLLTYVADKRDPVMKDGEPNYRLRCIFENRTESDLLMLSLARDLYRHGRRVSREGESTLGLEDRVGFIYVVRSLSRNPAISSHQSLFKIGFSRGVVEGRLRNAEKSPTYLMAPVQIVETFEVNVNVSKLEYLLHVFFSEAKFEIEVTGEDGTTYVPREWFDIPIECVGEAVQLLIRGDITDYRYDVARRGIISR